MAEITAVCFDLDWTLCRYDHPPEVVLDRAFEAVGVDPLFSVEAYISRFDSHAADAPDMRTLRRRIFTALARERGSDPEVGREVADAYSAYREPENVSFREGAVELLDLLAPDYELALITNGFKPAQQRKLDALDLGSTFDSIVFAGFDTAYKPSPEPFRHALEEPGVKPAAAIHIGDSLEKDVGGANAAGLQSVWLPPAGVEPRPGASPAIEPDYIGSTPRDLVPPPWSNSSAGPAESRPRR